MPAALHANCLQMIQKKQWPHNSPDWTSCRYRVWRAMHEAFSKLHPKPNTVSALKGSHYGEEFGKIVRRTKLSRVLKEVERAREGRWKTFSAFALTQKNVHANDLCAVLNAVSVRQFLITWKPSGCHDNSRVVLLILYVIIIIVYYVRRQQNHTDRTPKTQNYTTVHTSKNDKNH